MNSAILLAGGSGKRMGGVDKLMLKVHGRTLLSYVLQTFESCSAIQEIILVAHKDRTETYRQLAKEHQISKISQIVPGGAERQDSVWEGLQAVSSSCKIVLIHDAARSLVSQNILERCIQTAEKTGAVIPAVRVKDTIKQIRTPEGQPPFIEQTLDRSMLWSAQTPQTFHLDLIRRAYEPLISQKRIVTDDATAVEQLGHSVAIVEGDGTNFKITTPEDLRLAEAVLPH